MVDIRVGRCSVSSVNCDFHTPWAGCSLPTDSRVFPSLDCVEFPAGLLCAQQDPAPAPSPSLASLTPQTPASATALPSQQPCYSLPLSLCSCCSPSMEGISLKALISHPPISRGSVFLFTLLAFPNPRHQNWEGCWRTLGTLGRPLTLQGKHAASKPLWEPRGPYYQPQDGCTHCPTQALWDRQQTPCPCPHPALGIFLIRATTICHIPHVLIWFPACHPGREYESPAGRDFMCLVIKESPHLGRAWHTVGLQNICAVHLP